MHGALSEHIHVHDNHRGAECVVWVGRVGAGGSVLPSQGPAGSQPQTGNSHNGASCGWVETLEGRHVHCPMLTTDNPFRQALELARESELMQARAEAKAATVRTDTYAHSGSNADFLHSQTYWALDTDSGGLQDALPAVSPAPPAVCTTSDTCLRLKLLCLVQVHYARDPGSVPLLAGECLTRGLRQGGLRLDMVGVCGLIGWLYL